MRYVFLCVLVSLGMSVFGQNPTNYIPYKQRTRQYSMMLDSMLYVPRYCGAPSIRINETSTIDGAIAIDTCNHVFYIYSGGSWIATGAGSTNSNIGSGYRLAVPGTNNIKTLFPGLYAYADSSSNTNGITVGIDSSSLFAYGLRRKDSVPGGYYPYSSNPKGYLAAVPTLQQVLTAGSTLTTDNSINLGGYDLEFTGGAGTTGITFTNLSSFGVDLASNSRIIAQPVGGNTGETSLLSGSRAARTSQIQVLPDSIFIKPSSGNILIDSLNNFSDTTNWKPMVHRESTGEVRRATYWPGGGGSPAGNFGNLQINRNGAFATPGSDSLDYEASTGLEVKAPLTFRSASLYGTNLTVKDQAGTTRWFSFIDGNNSPVFQGPPYWRFLDGANEYFRIEGNDASSTSASVQVRTVVSGKAGVRVDLAGSATNDALQVYNSGANKIFNVTSEGGIDLYNYGTAPAASVTNGVRLYAEDVSSSAELKVRDEAGNITTLSPHNFGKIPGGRSEKMAWSFYSERNGEYITADMTKALRTIEKQSAEIEELKAQLAELKGVMYQKKAPVKLVYKGKK